MTPLALILVHDFASRQLVNNSFWHKIEAHGIRCFHKHNLWLSHGLQWVKLQNLTLKVEKNCVGDNSKGAKLLQKSIQMLLKLLTFPSEVQPLAAAQACTPHRAKFA